MGVLIIDSQDVPAASRLKGATAAETQAFLNELGADGWEVQHLDWRELERRMSFMGVAKRKVASR